MAGALYIHPRTAPLYQGVVVPASKLYFSRTGTSTAQNTYSDSALATPNANPVVADSSGVFSKIYLDGGTGYDYRVTWKTSADVQLTQDDDVKATGTESALYRVKGTAPEYIFQETDASANNTRWRVRVDAEQMVVSVGNDAESSWVDAVKIDRTANVVDTINLLATAVQSNGVSLAANSSGTFTPTWGGFSAPPTGDIAYNLIAGKLVLLSFPVGNTGTSNSTGFSLTSLPSAIRPSTDSNPRLALMVVDNAVYSVGAVGFGTPAGKLVFYKGVSDTGWTASGTKGLPPLAVLMYGI